MFRLTAILILWISIFQLDHSELFRHYSDILSHAKHSVENILDFAGKSLISDHQTEDFPLDNESEENDSEALHTLKVFHQNIHPMGLVSFFEFFQHTIINRSDEAISPPPELVM